MTSRTCSRTLGYQQFNARPGAIFTVKQVLADFTQLYSVQWTYTYVTDDAIYCKALCDEKFSQIE